MAGAWSNVVGRLGNRQLRIFLGGRFAYQTSTWMYRLAIGWTVWELTHSAAWLGAFHILDRGPSFFLTPLGGALADRMDALKLMRTTQAFLLVHAIMLAALMMTGTLNVWLLAAFTVVYGSLSALQIPANQTIIPSIVSREEMTTAFGLNSLSFNVSRFVGPIAAGYIIGFWGAGPAILCNAVGAAVLSFCLMLMHAAHSTPRKTSAGGHVLRDLADGFSYAIKHPGIGPSMTILGSLSCLTLTVDAMLPGLADGVFHAGATGLAWMAATLGAGAICLAIYLTQRGGIAGLTRIVTAAVLTLGAAYVALSLISSFWVALICCFAAGFSAMAILTGSLTLMQFSVDPEMRGRVSGFYGLITHAGPGLGAILLGTMGDHFGLQTAFGFAGAATIAIGVWAVLKGRTMAPALETPAPAKTA